MKQTNEIHPTLGFEQRRVQEAQLQLQYVNNVIWAVQAEFGLEFVQKRIWTYGCGIEFKELSKEEFAIAKTIVSDFAMNTLGDMKKESNQNRLQLSTHMIIGTILNDDDEEKDVDTTVSFQWGIPDTCEIVETTTKEAVRDSSAYTIDDNGQIYKEVTTREVKCTKPLLEAVFLNQQGDG